MYDENPIIKNYESVSSDWKMSLSSLWILLLLSAGRNAANPSFLSKMERYEEFPRLFPNEEKILKEAKRHMTDAGQGLVLSVSELLEFFDSCRRNPASRSTLIQACRILELEVEKIMTLASDVVSLSYQYEFCLVLFDNEGAKAVALKALSFLCALEKPGLSFTEQELLDWYQEKLRRVFLQARKDAMKAREDLLRYSLIVLRNSKPIPDDEAFERLANVDFTIMDRNVDTEAILEISELHVEFFVSFCNPDSLPSSVKSLHSLALTTTKLFRDLKDLELKGRLARKEKDPEQEIQYQIEQIKLLEATQV